MKPEAYAVGEGIINQAIADLEEAFAIYEEESSDSNLRKAINKIRARIAIRRLRREYWRKVRAIIR